MIVLKDILYKIPIEKVIGSTTVAVRNIEFDSREVGLNDVFVAIKGTVSDGHDFITKASEKGALVIICETLPETIINGITYVQVADSHKALAILAANYYENPSENIKLNWYYRNQRKNNYFNTCCIIYLQQPVTNPD